MDFEETRNVCTDIKGGVHLWDEKTLETMKVLPEFNDGVLLRFGLRTAGRRVLSSPMQVVQVWDVGGPERMLLTIPVRITDRIQSFAITNDGNVINGVNEGFDEVEVGGVEPNERSLSTCFFGGGVDFVAERLRLGQDARGHDDVRAL
ncbi:hypothetical protein BWQ96_09559 [Gracilariopsis chorda]|uniref:Uncharacterized protein n=1 Tax=Gracilariopsis chorda TaxID=448386 RepID=A0A2V3IF64_9FLOR|nr:hypothetical protein BWQ96_09559 [Gracilariopsis chorda]|eukprot:PXF40726.1 hypothetical protein BWQ96_09559 [Gracilariopsis chorda]